MAEVTPQELVQLAMSLVNTDLKLQCQNWAIALEGQKNEIRQLAERLQQYEKDADGLRQRIFLLEEAEVYRSQKEAEVRAQLERTALFE